MENMDVSPEKKEKILSQLAKLLTTANDRKGTPEGEAFMRKASSMMAKYRIAESEIDFGDPDQSYVVDDDEGIPGLCDEGGRRQWVVDLGSRLAYTFDCKMYFRERAGTVHFLGSESDVETVCYFFEIVLNHINREARKMWPKQINWRKRNEFGTAAMIIISIRLSEMKEMMDTAEKEYTGGFDIVVRKKNTVQEFWDEFSANMDVKKRKDVELKDRRTWLAGYKAGETAPLNKGIGHDEHEEIES